MVFSIGTNRYHRPIVVLPFNVFVGLVLIAAMSMVCNRMCRTIVCVAITFVSKATMGATVLLAETNVLLQLFLSAPMSMDCWKMPMIVSVEQQIVQKKQTGYFALLIQLLHWTILAMIVENILCVQTKMAVLLIRRLANVVHWIVQIRPG
jgi:hypothetical protein